MIIGEDIQYNSLDNQDVSRLFNKIAATLYYRELFSVVSQNPYLFSKTIKESIKHYY